jgi:hypothetical protein
MPGTVLGNRGRAVRITAVIININITADRQKPIKTHRSLWLIPVISAT